MAGKPRRISAQDRRRQILAVAMELFARQGFEGTTTRKIAEQAKVNEAIIFRHFLRKEDLYWAIIDGKCRGGKGRDDLRKKLEGNGNDHELFAAISEDLLRRNSQDAALSRLLLFSALENHRLSHRFFRTYVAGYYETLADHIRKRIREGVYRRVDPLLAARGFLGMVIYHHLIQEIFGGRRYQKFDPKRVSSTLSDIWLRGMLTADGHGRGSKKPSRQPAEDAL